MVGLACVRRSRVAEDEADGHADGAGDGLAVAGGRLVAGVGHGPTGGFNEATMTWAGSGDLSALAGRKLIIAFRLRRAKLFAYRLADDQGGQGGQQGGQAEEKTIM